MRHALPIAALLAVACTPLEDSRSALPDASESANANANAADGASLADVAVDPPSFLPMGSAGGPAGAADADTTSTAPMTPAPGTPDAALSVGADAASPSFDAAVAVDPSCRDDSACETRSCSPSHLCQMPQPVGSACDSMPDCQAGATCVSMQCKAGDGASCTNDSLCASGSCVTTCRAPAPLGSSCDSQNDCVTGLQCEDARCKLSLGQTCSADTDCMGGSCYRVCQLPRKAPSPCDTNPDCSFATCISGLCLKALSAMCQNDSECQSGSCNWAGCMAPQGRLYNCNSAPDCLAPFYCSTCGFCEDGTGGCNN